MPPWSEARTLSAASEPKQIFRIDIEQPDSVTSQPIRFLSIRFSIGWSKNGCEGRL
jgi:hypothetical protein